MPAHSASALAAASADHRAKRLAMEVVIKWDASRHLVAHMEKQGWYKVCAAKEVEAKRCSLINVIGVTKLTEACGVCKVFLCSACHTAGGGWDHKQRRVV